jgi:multidrug efflux pump
MLRRESPLAEKDLLTKLVFPLAVIFVLLVLAAQYESWSLPLAIILIVPMCILAAVAGLMVWKLDVNIFTQIGLVLLIGLAAKNAILIVEFAKQLEDQGKSRFNATVEACRLRLRPILMTSFAFILGVVPLVLAKGAGAEMRHTLGVAVFSGMLGVTVFGIFFTPVFYSVIRWMTSRKQQVVEPARKAKRASSSQPIDGINRKGDRNEHDRRYKARFQSHRQPRALANFSHAARQEQPAWRDGPGWRRQLQRLLQNRLID